MVPIDAPTVVIFKNREGILFYDLTCCVKPSLYINLNSKKGISLIRVLVILAIITLVAKHTFAQKFEFSGHKKGETLEFRMIKN